MSLDVKVGDKVLISGRYVKKINTVDKITPTGIIRVGPYSFNPDGKQRGGDPYYTCTLEKVTPEMEKMIHQERFTQVVTQKMIEILSCGITYEQAEALNEMFNLGFHGSK